MASEIATYSKTTKGIEEIAKRTVGLNPRVRQLLILVDGKRNAVDLAKLLPEAQVELWLDQLISDGFIQSSDFKEPAKPSNPNFAAYTSQSNLSEPSVKAKAKHVARMLIETLGSNADDFALRIERCNSIDELRELVPQVLAVVESVAGEQAMANFVRKIGDI
jgi:hypothetical protein